MSFANPSQHIAELGLRPGMHVVDLGAGAGYHALEAGRIVGEHGRVIAVDIQRDLLERLAREAMHKKLSITTVVSDLEHTRGTTLRDESLDAAILSNTLFQVEKKLHVISEAFRILKPGGRLLLVEWSGSHRGVGPNEEYVVSVQETQDLLAECGFSLEREVSAGAHHYALIVRK